MPQTSAIGPTWPLQGEERQVHSGENFLDPPDFARDAFAALAWLRGASARELVHPLDVACCHADLNHLTWLALALERR